MYGNLVDLYRLSYDTVIWDLWSDYDWYDSSTFWYSTPLYISDDDRDLDADQELYIFHDLIIISISIRKIFAATLRIFFENIITRKFASAF